MKNYFGGITQSTVLPGQISILKNIFLWKNHEILKVHKWRPLGHIKYINDVIHQFCALQDFKIVENSDIVPGKMCNTPKIFFHMVTIIYYKIHRWVKYNGEYMRQSTTCNSI